MSAVNICDRCGSLVRGVALGAISLVTSGDSDRERVDKELCPGCIEDLLPLIETEVEPKQRGYKDPYRRTPEPDAVNSATSEQLAAALLTKLVQENPQKSIGNGDTE